MNKTDLYLLHLLRCALCGAEPEAWDGIDLRRLVYLAEKQGLLSLLSGTFERLDGMPEELRAAVKRRTAKLRAKEKFRNIYLTDLCLKLEAERLYVMPLKGFVIKNLYPEPWMREMNDVDILIEKDKADEVKALLEKEGYVYDHDSLHEIVYNLDPFINLELHTSAISYYYKGIYTHFEDALERSVPLDGHEYIRVMTPPDLYVHTLTHFAMHYCTAGGGIKPVVDLWLIKHKHDLDMEYVGARLKALGLEKFESVISHLASVWFEGAEHTPETQQTERLMLLNSAYGSTEDYTMLRFYRIAENDSSRLVKRFKVLKSVMFMKPATLAVKYPGLRHRPYLYPFYTVYRWFDILKRRGGEVGRMARVTMSGKGSAYDKRLKEVIENNKMMGFKKDFFDDTFYE
ncbi:MAG TPA: nucleotidyltransferase family protein [Candidatus Monoglobus merdigallinarum]|uniref:Nucleotidyltransferase family protein n=1 Tax=Candidatus Monoglobus merdigallinarum TaxID=2838698 RepID=A0A9D1PNZ4_9FIRM|nr:nucleotidyltransferase family protein [Candidatus Monoglobus merdigallinarum]